MIAWRPFIPDGILPFSSVLLGAMAAIALVVLSVAVASESLQFTVGAEITCNLLFQGVMFGAANTPAIGAHLGGDTALWNTPVLLFLGAELALGAILLGAALWLQSRKTDFL